MNACGQKYGKTKYGKFNIKLLETSTGKFHHHVINICSKDNRK